MLYGFAVNIKGCGTEFFMVSATTADSAMVLLDSVLEGRDVEDYTLQCAEDLINEQYEGIAVLSNDAGGF